MRVNNVASYDGTIRAVRSDGRDIVVTFMRYDDVLLEVRLLDVSCHRVSRESLNLEVQVVKLVDGRRPFGLGRGRSSLLLTADPDELLYAEFNDSKVRRL